MTLFLMVFISTSKAVSQNTESLSENIKIGLLISNSKSIAAVQGAETAVRIANRKGGLNGCHFQLVVRSMEGPWGTGSKQAVNLIFEERVWALFGSHDGRNAHLVEQVATKSQVVFVSAWSGDPTLSQAFVPWFFNCVPNDNQQAASLIEEIYEKRKFKKIAVVHENDYDSEMSLGSFLKSVKISGSPDPVQYNYDNFRLKLNNLSDKINEADADCVVIFCQPSASVEIVRQIRQKKMNIPVFGSIMLLNENELTPQELSILENVISIPSGEWPESGNLIFRNEFQTAYEKMPGVIASYSFDGMNVLIEAIRNAGSPDREKIQKSLEVIQHKGITGVIKFDDKGNRVGSFDPTVIKSGIPLTFIK